MLQALVAAAASVAKRDQDTLTDLPLDEFIDAVRVIGVALMERNAEYLTGPVSDAVDRVTRLLQEASGEESEP
ncbi:MAG: hypothetical protein L0H70_10495 [Xanthomonadales bacterium]|nr:hypothetical protein [Xanthomonadales bacterium]